MPAEDMGKVTKRLRLIFAISSVVLLVVLAVSPVRDYLSDWRRYERDYVRFAETRPDTKRLLADFRPEIDQIWIPQMQVVDRCTTCHQGITRPSLADASVPQPFRAHPPIPHRVREWGCVVCHRGQGLATSVRDAHETTLAWEQPVSIGPLHPGFLRNLPSRGTARDTAPRSRPQASPHPQLHRLPSSARSGAPDHAGA